MTLAQEVFVIRHVSPDSFKIGEIVTCVKLSKSKINPTHTFSNGATKKKMQNLEYSELPQDEIDKIKELYKKTRYKSPKN